MQVHSRLRMLARSGQTGAVGRGFGLGPFSGDAQRSSLRRCFPERKRKTVILGEARICLLEYRAVPGACPKGQAAPSPLRLTMVHREVDGAILSAQASWSSAEPLDVRGCPFCGQQEDRGSQDDPFDLPCRDWGVSVLFAAGQSFGPAGRSPFFLRTFFHVGGMRMSLKCAFSARKRARCAGNGQGRSRTILDAGIRGKKTSFHIGLVEDRVGWPPVRTQYLAKAFETGFHFFFSDATNEKGQRQGAAQVKQKLVFWRIPAKAAAVFASLT